MLTGNPVKDYAMVLKRIAHEAAVIQAAVAKGQHPTDVAVRSLARYQAQATELHAAIATLDSAPREVAATC